MNLRLSHPGSLRDFGRLPSGPLRPPLHFWPGVDVEAHARKGAPRLSWIAAVGFLAGFLGAVAFHFVWPVASTPPPAPQPLVIVNGARR